ncbi:hypothetical protein GCM10025877_06890 [Agromyces mangrovi Wang et al. 2018]|nr:family 20 glycosylhydrolase [Agromyces mangrovi]BDZ63751.1 hypothetical protein GCM10025877_06890 [Agromyces mangrovi]
MQTLRQLLPVALEASDGPFAVAVPAVRIADAPRFAYRGVMLDVARRFFPVEEVLRLIDEIALVKANHLHLHLTDDQGWRIAVDAYPALTGIGASTSVDGRGGGHYSKADYARIVAHAASRHLTVVPEIDLPGHTHAALTAVPELNPDGVAPAPYEGVEVGFSGLDPHAPATWTFVERVLGEVAAMTPGPYLHIGGDETLSTSEADYLAFVARATAIAAGTGKTVIGWHELGKSRELPAGTIGQYWSWTTPQDDSAERTRSFVAQGGRVILSPPTWRTSTSPIPAAATAPTGDRSGRTGPTARPRSPTRTGGTPSASCRASTSPTSSASRHRSGPRPSRASPRRSGCSSRASRPSPRSPGRPRRPSATWPSSKAD